MPLVLLCGYPGSGKTQWSEFLQQQFLERIEKEQPGGGKMKVILHSDESLGINHEMYADASGEKAARAAQMAAVKRDLARNTIVILNTLSYNKGFRYQLFCECKATHTTQVLVQTVAPIDACFANNKNSTNPWSDTLLTALVARFEEPDAARRWDSPLVAVAADDFVDPTLRTQVIDQCWSLLGLASGSGNGNGKDILPPKNQSTTRAAVVPADYLHELDRATQRVVQKVLAAAQTGLLPGSVVVEEEVTVYIATSTVSAAALQRFRRAFVGLNRARPLAADRIAPLFGQYLSAALAE